MRRWTLIASLWFLGCVAAVAPARGQVPRAYLNAPQGDLVMYSYAGTRSNTGGVKNLPVPRAETRLQTQSLIYSRIIDVGGRTGGLGVAVPFVDLLSL